MSAYYSRGSGLPLLTACPSSIDNTHSGSGPMGFDTDSTSINSFAYYGSPLSTISLPSMTHRYDFF